MLSKAKAPYEVIPTGTRVNLNQDPIMKNSNIKPPSSRKLSNQIQKPTRKRRSQKSLENKDVLVSAVISTYLLTHLHHVLQKAEFGATREGRQSQAKNFAQLRKVLCMDARSMVDASAQGLKDEEIEQKIHAQTQPDAA